MSSRNEGRRGWHVSGECISMSLLVFLVTCSWTGASPSIASAEQCQSAAAPGADATGLAVVKPAEVAMDPERLSHIQPILQEAIDKKQIPGAVVLVVRQGKICFRKAIGFRSLEPPST